MSKDSSNESLVQIGFSKFIKNNSLRSTKTPSTHQFIFLSWQISDYSKQWSQILSQMRETQVCQIYVKYCMYSYRSRLHRDILDRISHINFVNLTILSLPSIFIESIEPILKIRTSNLKSLNLKNNCITNIRSLAKSDLSELVQLNLKFPRMNYLNLTSITRINIDDRVKSPYFLMEKIGVVENINWMGKMKRKGDLAIQYNLQGRIQQRKMKQMMQRNRISFYK